MTTTAFTSFLKLVLLVLGFTSTILVDGLTASSVAKSNNALSLDKMIPNSNNQVDVCIIGAGPVGLATAITLSQPPHNYNCVVIEADAEVNSFNPRKGFTYNVNPRGRSFTRQYPEIDELLQKTGVISRGQDDMKRFCLIPSDPNEPLPELAVQASNEMKKMMEGNTSNGSETLSSSDDDGMIVNDDTNSDKDVKAAIQHLGKGGLVKEGYWIQRHELNKLLRDYCSLQGKRSSIGKGSIAILSGLRCIDVIPVDPCNENNDEKDINSCGVEVIVENVSTKEKINLQCNLVVGADGMKSKVRDLISSQDNAFNRSSLWETTHKSKFQVKKYKSPSTGIRVKVLQFPMAFPIPNSDGTEVTTNETYLYGIRSTHKGPTNSMSLGVLPSSNNNPIRPVNIIARPDHDVWKITDPNELREWFQNAFPRMKFGKENSILPNEEWERFIAAEGTRFPLCQYTNGVSISSVDKKSAVVLVGDALHSYPPDIGQGVNSGLADVVQLGKSLEDVDLSIDKSRSKSKEMMLGDAMKSFEKNRLGETKALIRLARFGWPYQYNQPQLKHKIGKKLWTMNMLLRLLLNKVSFGLVPQGALMLSQDASLSFKQVMQRVDLVTFVLRSLVLGILIKLFWNKLPLSIIG